MNKKEQCARCGWDDGELIELFGPMASVGHGFMRCASIWVHEDSHTCRTNERANAIADAAFGMIGR